MNILQSKRLYLPALSIVAVVLLLLVLISISTYRNLDRDKKKALTFVHRQGLGLLRALEAGARSGMMMSMWDEDSVGSLVRETGQSEDIAYVYLFDKQGIIVHHSDPSLDGTPAAWNPRLADKEPGIDKRRVETRVRILPDGSRVYELAKRFSPFQASSAMLRHHGMMGREPMMPRHTHADDMVVLGLKMTAFDAARRADLDHAMVMAGILVALGSGAFFFIFVIQNYYLVDRTLKQTRDYTRQVVANMANGLLSVDPEGRVASYNLLAIDLLGLKESEVPGMDLKAVLDFKTTGIQKTLLRCQPVLEREIQHRKPSGQTVSLALSVTPIKDENGACRAAVLVLRDLSEIKRLEEKVRRSEKLAAIGKLAAGVAHEIRNPLSSVRGFAQFLRHSLTDRPQECEYAEIMVKEVDRINRVVTDLLTFARPLEAERAPTDVNELVNHTVRLIQEDARSRGVKIHRAVAPDLNQVPLDANQITQALLNLMLNALQAMEAGGNIELGAGLYAHPTRLRIWAEDDGPGIAPEHLGKIFDPFFTTRERGTGLGLAIVHKIVENHGGEIRGESPPRGKSRGCRFTIEIPIDI